MIKYSEKYILRIQLEILKKHKNVNISNIAPCITHCLLNFSNFWIWQDLKKKQIFSGVVFSHIPESESREHSEFIKWIKWRLNLSSSKKKKKYNSTFILETKSFKKKNPEASGNNSLSATLCSPLWNVLGLFHSSYSPCMNLVLPVFPLSKPSSPLVSKILPCSGVPSPVFLPPLCPPIQWVSGCNQRSVLNYLFFLYLLFFCRFHSYSRLI